MNPLLYSKIEGSGKPLIIVHGFLGMSDNWKTLGSQFAAIGFEVHLLDMRNHGRSFHTESFSYEAMANDVLKYCEHHNLEEINIIGHSMGGKIAMVFATQNPKLASKLVVADISPRYYAPHHQQIMRALNAVDFETITSRNDVEEILSAYISDFGTLQFLMKNVHRKDNSQFGFRFNLNAFNKNIGNIGEALPQDAYFDKPTLFVKGSKSDYITQNDEADIRNYFPQAKIVTISDAGHWLHADNPSEFYEKVNDFLM